MGVAPGKKIWTLQLGANLSISFDKKTIESPSSFSRTSHFVSCTTGSQCTTSSGAADLTICSPQKLRPIRWPVDEQSPSISCLIDFRSAGASSLESKLQQQWRYQKIKKQNGLLSILVMPLAVPQRLCFTPLSAPSIAPAPPNKHQLETPYGTHCSVPKHLSHRPVALRFPISVCCFPPRPATILPP